jgi:conjugative transfer region protein TrbK
MRGPLLNISATSWVAGFGLVAAAIIATAVHFNTEKAEPASAAPRSATTVDPLAADLARCQALGIAALDDASCKAIWAENRRRFFTYQPGDGETAATLPQTSASKMEDR